jgi:hypothetical protein
MNVITVDDYHAMIEFDSVPDMFTDRFSASGINTLAQQALQESFA